jgi:organic hydroperoxide reductase OsmC/OhrA
MNTPTSKLHLYKTSVVWTGNMGTGTSDYRAYSRAHEITAEQKLSIHGSSDPAFRGDSSRYNPEELLVSSLSACHMLWYLHLCSAEGVVVTEYHDQATGSMEETEDGGGAFVEVTLRPNVTVLHTDMMLQAEALHAKAHTLCFIARSVRFPVRHEPHIRVQNG